VSEPPLYSKATSGGAMLHQGRHVLHHQKQRSIAAAAAVAAAAGVLVWPCGGSQSDAYVKEISTPQKPF